MQTANGRQTGIAAEWQIVPTWLKGIAALGFIAAQVLFDVLIARQADGPPPWARVLLGLLVGTVFSCYVLLIGYVNRDARRRAMSPALWTIVAIFIPNGLGILLYFILRQPLAAGAAEYGNPTMTGSCPRCGYVLQSGCPNCRQAVGHEDVYCRHCGTSLHSTAVPV